MKLTAKEIIRLLLTREGIQQKDLAKVLTEKTQKKYTPGSLSQKIYRDSITYNEVLLIADILGYDIEFVRRENS